MREGIHAALGITGARCKDSPPEAQLSVSLPPSLSEASKRNFREAPLDLRACLIDMVAGAKLSLIVASLFWDAETAGEMASHLDKSDKSARHRLRGCGGTGLRILSPCLRTCTQQHLSAQISIRCLFQDIYVPPPSALNCIEVHVSSKESITT